MKLRPKLDSMIISGALQRNLNAKYRIAPQSLADKSPYHKDATFGDKKVIPVYGFSNSKEKIDLTEENVTYSLAGWNSVMVNGAKTSLLNTNSIKDVAASLNFASSFKQSTIRRTGSIAAQFMFGKRDVMVDNPLLPSYHKKFVNVPKNLENHQQVVNTVLTTQVIYSKVV